MFDLGKVVLLFIVCCTLAEEDGTWRPGKYGKNSGRYVPDDEGKYVHVAIPYTGGYGPYHHVPNPYKHIANPYLHDEDPYKGEASLQKPVIEPKPIYKYVLTDKKDNPYFKPGYYKNNGIKIIRHNKDHKEDNYKYVYETENKILAEEQARIKHMNTKDEGIASSGYYQYIGPDGFLYRVDYTADEKGFIAKPKRIATQYSGKFVKVKVN